MHVGARAGDVGTFVDETKCAECHREETAAWRGSHHDLAMQEPNASTVLGNFDDASFTYGDVTTRFSRRGEKFVVTTDGVDGKPAAFDVSYVFGLTPLQQYLLPLPAGRLQALSVAWNAEQGKVVPPLPEREGGLSRRAALDQARAELENFMCAECHSTDVEKKLRRQERSLRHALVPDQRRLPGLSWPRREACRVGGSVSG